MLSTNASVVKIAFNLLKIKKIDATYPAAGVEIGFRIPVMYRAIATIPTSNDN